MVAHGAEVQTYLYNLRTYKYLNISIHSIVAHMRSQRQKQTRQRLKSRDERECNCAKGSSDLRNRSSWQHRQLFHLNSAPWWLKNAVILSRICVSPDDVEGCDRRSEEVTKTTRGGNASEQVKECWST
jgi:hypothetical protein